MRLRYYTALLLIVSVCFTAKGQSTSALFTSELNVKFNTFEIKRLERAAKLINDAEVLLKQADDMYAVLSELEKKERLSSGYRAALKKLYESSETTKEAYGIVYAVFYDKNSSFWQKMSRENRRAAGMDKAKYYQGTSLKNQNRSLMRRRQVLESDRYEYSKEIMEDALEYEKLAARDQARALQICTDYPVEYNYGWEDDLSLEQIVKIMKNPIIHEPPNDIFATVDEKAAVDTSLLKDVIFKVQIAAHTSPLNQEYLNLSYGGDLPIDLIYEEDWYKYSIGVFRTFEEAEATRREVNIRKAFVVAYCEGKKITIKEAIDLVERKRTAGM